MPIKLVARDNIVKINEVISLFDNVQIANNYLKCLNSQIKPDNKGEFHHIIPKCISKDNSQQNIVYISLSNHFKCHYFLTFVKDESLRDKMCFAFKQMLNTRNLETIKINELESYSNRFEELVSKGVFKNNYDRTESIRNKIAKSVSTYLSNAKPKWVNNGTVEKFVPSELLVDYLNNGFTLGRIIQSDVAIKASISSKKVHNEKKNGTYKPTRKALYKRELRKRKFLEALKPKNNDKTFIVSDDGKTYKKMSVRDILSSKSTFRPYCFWR